MSQATLDLSSTAAWFESVYSDAEGDVARIPWSDGHPHPALVTWLNAVAPSLVRCGARVCVVGCGLGDDARELMRRGYDVTAFDCSRTAVAWARRLDPANAACYEIADLFEIPTRWRHRFDLVIEINTIQVIPPDHRAKTVRSIAQLLSPHGHLLVVCRHADGDVALEAGPPWPISVDALEHGARAAGLVADGPIAVFNDDEVPPVPRMRALFRPDPRPDQA